MKVFLFLVIESLDLQGPEMEGMSSLRRSLGGTVSGAAPTSILNAVSRVERTQHHVVLLGSECSPILRGDAPRLGIIFNVVRQQRLQEVVASLCKLQSFWVGWCVTRPVDPMVTGSQLFLLHLKCVPWNDVMSCGIPC